MTGDCVKLYYHAQRVEIGRFIGELVSNFIVGPQLRSAVRAAQEQPGQVPAVPQGWVEQARAALDAEDAGRISIAVDTILLAHSQYRADFDIKGWLYELRNAQLVATGRPELVLN